MTALHVAGGALTLLWWAPTLALMLAGLWADRARFGLVMAWADVLKAAGRRDAAGRLYSRERARCERRMAGAAGRRRG